MMIEPSSSLHSLLKNVFQSVFNIFQRWSTQQHHQSPGNTLDTTKLDIEPNAENAPLIQNLVTPHLSVAISSHIQCSKLEEVFGKKKHS
jgi:hypothetical protein